MSFSRRLVAAGLLCASVAKGLDLDTFTGQAQVLGRQREMILSQQQGDNEVKPMRMMAEPEADDSDGKCTKKKGCKLGCCGPLDKEGFGICGTGPKFCGTDCTSECDYKSECDPGGWGLKYSNFTTCPLNVCCSDYGFCGTLSSYCKGKTVASPKCDKAKHSSDKRTIGYYEGWNYQRPCGNMEPEDIPLGYYTHINFAFALVNPDTYRLDPMDKGTASRYGRVSALTQQQDGLEVWIAIGGWAMNDPGKYRTVFSDLAKSEKKQDAFFDSLITFLQRYDFDGVDLDWEYPVAEDRGGVEEDFENYVNLLARLRKRLNSSGRKYGLTLTLYTDGVWDENIESLGPYAHAHTNLTEIQQGLELLWRNNINHERVVMGLGFYGRSFTMKSANCLDAGCEFSEGAKGGECTGTKGVLSASEINKVIKNGGKMKLDEEAAVQIVTWDSNQWVSWDDAKTLKMKLDYANEHCLGG
ncbi:killer toxin subunits alpha beta [Fusarium mexicanum]|uniref:chitinase n=1 Tax=Fusarium mexicanum TaxID=751941 RepID=A0A8H5J7T7_9HYPO|nr:killer toxin subunits alpha beta [Fusarium mexicanum]